jgi:hypothetical protein
MARPASSRSSNELVRKQNTTQAAALAALHYVTPLRHARNFVNVFAVSAGVERLAHAALHRRQFRAYTMP